MASLFNAGPVQTLPSGIGSKVQAFDSVADCGYKAHTVMVTNQDNTNYACFKVYGLHDSGSGHLYARIPPGSTVPLSYGGNYGAIMTIDCWGETPDGQSGAAVVASLWPMSRR